MPLWVLFNHSVNHSEDVSDYKTYFNYYLQTYGDEYAEIHGYVALLICCFGFLFNVLNIAVFSRKNMISPINALLRALGVADMLVLLGYVPYLVHIYLRKNLEDQDKYSYGYVAFILFIFNFSTVSHTISTWLTVVIAAWRFMAICHPLSTRQWRGLLQAKKIILYTYIFGAVICIPFYSSYTVVQGHSKEGHVLHVIDFTWNVSQYDRIQMKVIFWLSCILIKIVPCAAVSFFSGILIRTLTKASSSKKHLQAESENHGDYDRITKMLVVVLLIYLLTNIPYGVLGLLNTILGPDFFYNVYLNLAETMEMLCLINSAVNFVFYYFMCEKFRGEFISLFTSNVSDEHKPDMLSVTQTAG